jgi:8-oxo-dGTP pyrophosphatase MutT (NUDIX family)
MSKYRAGVFIVVYAKVRKSFEYVILKRKKHWTGWEFPKGGIDNKENLRQTVIREVLEETGHKAMNVKKFDFSGKYDYGKEFPDRKGFTGQTYTLFAVEIKKGDIVFDEKEHSDSVWLNFEDAFEKLTWVNQKESLKIVDDWLNKRKKFFREIISSSGKLIYAGKNSKTNEELVKQAEVNEEVFHTSKPGSPFVNIKGSANKQDIEEASVFCAALSQDWRDNHSNVEVHWFKGKDIYKEKRMKEGCFGVRNIKKIKINKNEIKTWNLKHSKK